MRALWFTLLVLPSNNALEAPRSYDCDLGFSYWIHGWTDAKKDYCCVHHHKGCSPYNCSTGSSDSWDDQKSEWCCANFQKGCHTTLSPLGCDAPCTHYGETSTCDERIRFAEAHMFKGRDNACALAYSQVQVECDVCRACSVWAAGCNVDPGSEPYDCNAALSNFHRAWSPSKKVWCCTNKGKGCEGSHPPDVDPGSGMVWKHVYVNGYWTWAQLQVAWHAHTVTHHNVTIIYDCDSGLSNFHVGWSDSKKQWCCSRTGQGCEGRDPPKIDAGPGKAWKYVQVNGFWTWKAFSDDCTVAAEGSLEKSYTLRTIEPNDVRCPGKSTLLHVAIKHGKLANAEFLLKNGASVDAEDNFGNSALHLAVQSSKTLPSTEEQVELLLKAGAQVSLQNFEGNTPLHLTTSAAVAKLLLDHGADVDARNNLGQTALYLAGRTGSTQLAELLLRKGAAVDAQDSFWGKTPLAEAATSGHVQMAQILLEHGANAFQLTYDGRMIAGMVKESEAKGNATLLLLNEETTWTQLADKPQVRLWLPLAAVAGICYTVVQQFCARDPGPGYVLAPNCGEEEHHAKFVHGAKLLAAKTRSDARCGLFQHFVAVASKLVFVFACGMWIVHWPVWIPLHACLYMLPAMMQCGASKIMKYPALMLTGLPPMLELARLFCLLAVILLLARPVDCDQTYYHSRIAEAVCQGTPWVPTTLQSGMRSLQNPAWEALLRKPHYVWSKADLEANVVLGGSDSTTCMKLHAADVTIALLLCLLAACVLHVVNVVISISRNLLGLAKHQDKGQECADGLVEDLLEAAWMREQGAIRPPGVQLGDKWITLESSWNFDSLSGFMSSINVKVGLLLLDILLDMNTLRAMLLSGHFLFAMCMVMIMSKSLSQQIVAGNLRKLCIARNASINRGIQHRILLEILVEEQSFEAFASLALTTYSYWFTVADAFTAASQSFSIALSIYGLASFLYQSVDLGVDLEDITASASMSDGGLSKSGKQEQVHRHVVHS